LQRIEKKKPCRKNIAKFQNFIFQCLCRMERRE